MALTRAISPNTEKKLRMAQMDSVRECIYAVCVGYNRSHRPAEVLSIIQTIHELGMRPVLYSEENLAYSLSTIEVSADKDATQIKVVAEEISKKENTAVIIKQNDKYFIYGVPSTQQWTLTELSHPCFAALKFSNEAKVVSPQVLTEQMYAVINAVDGHREISKWLMENKQSLEYLKKIGGRYQELSEWEKEKDWQLMYEKLNTALSMQQFNKIRLLLNKDVADFVSSRGKYIGITEENAKQHILKCAAHILCMSKLLDKSFTIDQYDTSNAIDQYDTSNKRVLLCTDVASCVKEMMDKHLPHFKLDKESLKIIKLDFDKSEKLSKDIQIDTRVREPLYPETPGSTAHMGLSMFSRPVTPPRMVTPPPYSEASASIPIDTSTGNSTSPETSPKKSSTSPRKIDTGKVAARIITELMQKGSMGHVMDFISEYQECESTDIVEGAIATAAVQLVTSKNKQPGVVRTLFDTIKASSSASMSDSASASLFGDGTQYSGYTTPPSSPIKSTSASPVSSAPTSPEKSRPWFSALQAADDSINVDGTPLMSGTSRLFYVLSPGSEKEAAPQIAVPGQ
jgi:hypothetical protein